MAEKVTITLWDKNKKIKEIIAEDKVESAQFSDNFDKDPLIVFRNSIIKEKGVTYVNLEVMRRDREEIEAMRAAHDFILTLIGGKQC